jgi:hypothetical protein
MARRTPRGPKSPPQGFLVSDKRRLITSMTTENPDSLITVKNSLIAQSNSCSTPKNSLSGFLGNFLVSHCGSLPIFYCFPAWQGLTMKIPCIFPANRELALETGSLVTADRRWQAGLCRNRRAALREIDWRCSEGSRAADSPEGWVLARTRYDAIVSARLTVAPLVQRANVRCGRFWRLRRKRGKKPLQLLRAKRRVGHRTSGLPTADRKRQEKKHGQTHRDRLQARAKSATTLT